MTKDIQVSLYDMILCVSNTVDLISPILYGHHARTAYIAAAIAEEHGLPFFSQRNVMLAGLLHDVGALSLQARLNCLTFEDESRADHAHCGYYLLHSFHPLAPIASLVRYHHQSWRDGAGESIDGQPISLLCHVLHLADRIEVLIDKRQGILGQLSRIFDIIERKSGAVFSPDLVKSAKRLMKKESLWFDAVSPTIGRYLSEKFRAETILLDIDLLQELTKTICKIIDFRCRFTATHSSGVAETATALGTLNGSSPIELKKLRIAGNLHDLGKLAIPTEILQKPDRLTLEEFNTIKIHPYFTYRILESAPGLDEIPEWAAFHHERLNGNGYPFNVFQDKIGLGARIISIADVFTALTEDRPYRSGLSKEGVHTILNPMSANKDLDSEIVDMLFDHYEEIDDKRRSAQIAATKAYEQFFRLSQVKAA